MTSATFIPSTFTPAEAVVVSRLDTSTQKNLQRHGYMARPKKGWSRHSLEAAAKLLIIGQLQRLPPSESSEIADRLINGKTVAGWVVSRAQRVPGAISDPDRLAAGKLPLKTTAKVSGRFVIVYGNDVEVT